MIVLDFLESGQTINSDCYILMLTKLKTWIFRFRLEKKIMFGLQHNNSRSPISLNAVYNVANFDQTVLPYPLYSLDLAPFNFHLLEPMKDRLCIQHFVNNDVIIVLLWKSDLPPLMQILNVCDMQFVYDWLKCLISGGNYIKYCFVGKNFALS